VSEGRERLRAHAHGGDHATADKGKIAVIENVRVKIGDAHARAAGAHEFINGFREKSLDSESHLVGQIFSERAFSGGRIVDGSNAGKQKQVVIAKRVGSENHEIGRLKNFLA